MEEELNEHNAGLKAGRVVVNLTREELEFIDGLGRDALFTTGKRLTNNKIIGAFINVMKEIKIKGDGLYSACELKNRILVKLGRIKEKRLYLRVKKRVALSWHRRSSDEQFEEGVTIELGDRGFRIELKKPRYIGESLEFMINDPEDPSRPIILIGRVAWIERRDIDGGLEAGVKITHLDDKDRFRFSKLLYKEPSPDLYQDKK